MSTTTIRIPEEWKARIGSAAGRTADMRQYLEDRVAGKPAPRPVSNGKRELLIGREGRGHMASYQYVVKVDMVFVLAVRSRREAGYARTLD
jgi:toxin ParE1/3/4